MTPVFPEGFSNMLSRKKKLQLVAAFATFFLVVVGVACSGFFVAPVLTSIAVGPTATINQNATVQESAIGTYNDGSTKILGSGVQWSSSDTGFATVNTSGLVTGVSPGDATITAAFQATSGTSSITVSLGNVTALKITPQSNTVVVNGTTATPYFANATVEGQSAPVDVSPTAQWSTTDPTNLTINVPSTTGVGVTITAGPNTPTETVTVTAIYVSTTTLTATATLTVNQ
jgi:hypothetical protein